MIRKYNFPEGASFAFTILDDTDDTTLANGRPVYDFLNTLGIKTTKTVWSFDTPSTNRGPYLHAETLSSPSYLEWVHELHDQGFEIAFHNATMGSSLRGDTIRALNYLETEFGRPVRLHCNHGQNRENLHWGLNRYHSKFIRMFYALYFNVKPKPHFEGGRPDSPYYWSDIADKHISYIRSFTFNKLNLPGFIPLGPYKDKKKQKYSMFFNTIDAPNIDDFNRIVTPATIDRLQNKNGWAIVSTHFGKDFCRNGVVDQSFRDTMNYLVSKGGWFVPVSDLLDWLVEQNRAPELTAMENFRLEYAHIIYRILSKVSSL